MDHEPGPDLAALTQRQQFSLWLDGREGLQTTDDAQLFLSEVSLALRYGAGNELPLASMYRATQRHFPEQEDEKVAHARAFELTNNLLAGGQAIEINVVANRLAIVHPRLMPAIYTLRRANQKPVLTDTARRAFDFIVANQGASSGDVRRSLGVIGEARPDPGDLALAELQRELLIDRGPSSVPDHGIFYLSKEGYPYRALAEAHPDIPAAAAGLSRAQSAGEFLTSYLSAAGFAFPGKLFSMFKLLLSREEIEAALSMLVDRGKAKRIQLGKAKAVVFITK